jgi:cytochrome c553
MKSVVSALAVLLVSPFAHAADVEAGRARAQTVCAACHGAAGVSVSDRIPNLAAQKAVYLEAQLKALKEGTRKNPVMNAIASQLTGEDIANVAAYFASQPGATASAKSDFLPNLARSGVSFPESYKGTFTKYHAIDFPASRQVQYYFANGVALQAAKEGRPLPDGSVLLAEVYSAKQDGGGKPVTGSDGSLVPGELLFYSVMARDAGWGREIPEMLRNEDWNYAVFTPARQPRPGVNQAECLACHKPLGKSSFVFTLDRLAATARNR